MRTASRAGEMLAGKYRIERLLGSGGMGEVYLAQNTLIERPVAIKVLLPEYAAHEQIVARFLQEARAANIVRHPNVVDVIDIGQDADGTPFIVQEFLDGQDLGEILDELRGKLPVEAALELLLPIVDVIGYAHARGVVHRDLKPSNVFLARVGDTIVPKVLDFGIAKVVESTQTRKITATGLTMGTPAYIPPEIVQHGARVADPRSDVWALGVMLYEVLAGALPFDAETPSALFVLVCTSEPIPLAVAAPQLPSELSRIVSTCLLKDPDARYANASLLADDLRRVWSSLRSGQEDAPTASIRKFVLEAAARVSAVPAPMLQPTLPAQRTAPAPSTRSLDASPPADGADLPSHDALVPDLDVVTPARQSPPSSPQPVPSPVRSKPRPARVDKLEIDRGFSSPQVQTIGSASARGRRVADRAESDYPPSDGQSGWSDAVDVALLLSTSAVAAVAEVAGPEAPGFAIEQFGTTATIGLLAAAAVIIVVALVVAIRFASSGVGRIGGPALGLGAVGYAAVIGSIALRTTTIVYVPRLPDALVPAALLLFGAGVALVGFDRTAQAWSRRDRVVSSIAFAVAGLAGVSLALHTAAGILGFR